MLSRSSCSGAIHNLHEATQGSRAGWGAVRGPQVQGVPAAGISRHQRPACCCVIAVQGLQALLVQALRHKADSIEDTCLHLEVMAAR